MDQSKEGSKTTEGATLQQVLKKWKKLAAAPKDNSKKSIKFLKKTLSFSNAWAQSTGVPKGFLAVCVGEEMKRFVIPTDFLHHKAFQVLLREAEEEYGFRQEGVLRIPCQVAAFERILEMVQKKKKKEGFCYISPEVEAEMAMYHLHLPHKMMCR
ncbi:unnamed protein product [Musa banksii]